MNGLTPAKRVSIHVLYQIHISRPHSLIEKEILFIDTET